MILFLLTVVIPLVFAQRVCLNNGLLGPTGDKCYHFITALQKFDDAEVVCGMFNSVLVSITSGLESNFVLDNAHLQFPREYWIGLADLDTVDEWRWMDGQVTSYTNWGTGFPKNDTTKRCVAVQSSGKWMNMNCSNYTASFVCESEPASEFELTKCPPNGIEGIPGCFMANVVPETYSVSDAICGEFGSTLAQVFNSEQALSLMAVAKERFYKTDYWTGVSDPYDTGVWQFADGTPINFTHWAVGYPQSNGTKLCVASRLIDGKWYNAGCNTKKPSICQQKFSTPSDDEWNYFVEADSYYKGHFNAGGRIFEFEEICKAEGAHLASIHSFRENLFVASMVVNSISDLPVVIGVYYNSSKNALTWMDGTPWNYEYWGGTSWKAYAGYPCANQWQVQGNSNMMWGYEECSSVLQRHFVCKKPRV